MGTDNLFHKRKERKAELLRRRRAIKEPYDVILIVCEGEKTEPNYFSELKKAFRLSNANVRICGRGSDPLSVVNFAIEAFRREPEFDRVYCVFDRDRHTRYNEAPDMVRPGPGWAKEVKFSPFLRFPVLNFGYYCILYILPDRSTRQPVIPSVQELSRN
jgi:hypothetical protein